MEEGARQCVEDADEINLLDLVKVIWRHRWFIIWIVVIAVVATAIVSLIMTPIYEAKAVIIPSGVVSKDTGAASLFASQFGIAPPTTHLSAEIVNTLKSNTLKEKIIKKYNLLPILIEKPSPEDKDENKLMWKGIRRLEKITKINFIQKDNIVEITVQFKDP
ncbi:MAG: Wzz/FepE/Etk N-terminal domain-containing protein, partial [Syntrophorhabdaceae bacterium]|nr:Wzz/FepE/Etk N-terminal domain-containing protein [Syntrophorhabdaceae bacterium]